MTVCIAAVCDGGRSIVAATDQMLTLDYFTADLPGVVKGRELHRDWTVLFAGDIAHVDPIMDGTGLLGMVPTASVEDVTNALTASYKRRLRVEIEDKILSRYDLDIPKFVRTGLKTFGEVGFTELRREVEAATLGCDFMAFGFDKHRDAHIVTVHDPGVAKYHSRIGFWAIGSGAQPALSTLFFNRFNPQVTLPTAIYRVAEAKFMAESALGVGRQTIMVLVQDTGAHVLVRPPDIEPLRQLWEAEGRPRLPASTNTVVREMLDKFITQEAQSSKPTSSSSDHT